MFLSQNFVLAFRNADFERTRLRFSPISCCWVKVIHRNPLWPDKMVLILRINKHNISPNTIPLFICNCTTDSVSLFKFHRKITEIIYDSLFDRPDNLLVTGWFHRRTMRDNIHFVCSNRSVTVNRTIIFYKQGSDRVIG